MRRKVTVIEMENEEKLLEERVAIFREIDALDNVIHVLEATANCHYSSDDRMWAVLLKARDKVRKDIDKEEIILYKRVEVIDKLVKDIRKKKKSE